MIWENATLTIQTGAAGEQVIWITNIYARPIITSEEKISFEIAQNHDYWVITLKEQGEATILVELKN